MDDPVRMAASEQPRSDLRIVAAFAVLYVVWGSTYLAIRVALNTMPPLAAAAVRFSLAGPLMLLYSRLSGRTLQVPRRELRSLAIIGVLLLVGGNGQVVWAEQYVASGFAALIIATMPLWVCIASAFLADGERLPPLGWMGVATGFAGLGVLLWPKLAHGVHGEAWGAAALLGATWCWTTGSLYAKRVTLSVSPLVATGWEMVIAGGVLSCLAAATGQFSHFAPAAAAWCATAYLVIFGSCITFTAYIWLLQQVPAAKVTTYAYVNPVIAVLLGCVFLGEPFTPAIALGTPIIVIAVALVTTAKIHTAPAPSTAALTPAVGPADKRRLAQVADL